MATRVQQQSLAHQIHDELRRFVGALVVVIRKMKPILLVGVLSIGGLSACQTSKVQQRSGQAQSELSCPDPGDATPPTASGSLYWANANRDITETPIRSMIMNVKNCTDLELKLVGQELRHGQWMTNLSFDPPVSATDVYIKRDLSDSFQEITIRPGEVKMVGIENRPGGDPEPTKTTSSGISEKYDAEGSFNACVADSNECDRGQRGHIAGFRLLNPKEGVNKVNCGSDSDKLRVECDTSPGKHAYGKLVLRPK